MSVAGRSLVWGGLPGATAISARWVGMVWCGWLWEAVFVFFRRKKSSTSRAVGLSAEKRVDLSVAAVSRRAAGVDAVGLAAQYPALFAQWQNGGLRPTAVTLAFDPHAHAGRGGAGATTVFVGEWVDVACGVQEPAVDSWEAGLLYPTWEQLCKLAALTGTSLETLFTAPGVLEGLAGCVQEPLTFALRQGFHPAIVASTVSVHPHQPSVEEMANAIAQAVAAIQEQIALHTDPLSTLISDLVAETDRPQP